MATEESPLQLVTRQTKFPLETTGDTRAPHILAIVGFLTGLSTVLIVLRGYVRLYILRRFDIEDGVIVAALVSSSPPCLSAAPLTRNTVMRLWGPRVLRW